MKNKNLKDKSKKELMLLQDEYYKKYRSHLQKMALGMGIFMLLSLIPLGQTYQIFTVLMMLFLTLGQTVIGTTYFIKHLMAMNELKKRGLREKEVYEKTEKLLDNDFSVDMEENLELIPDNEMSMVFPEFSTGKINSVVTQDIKKSTVSNDVSKEEKKNFRR